MLCYCPWQYVKYYLRPMPRLHENPLRKNCFAHFGEQCSRDFGCGGRRLTGVSQGRQVQKYRTGPPKCGTGSAPVGPKNKSFHPTTGTKAKKFRGTTRFRPQYYAAALTVLNAHHTPVIGRSSRANQTPVPAGGLQPRPPFSVRNKERYFPVQSNNIGNLTHCCVFCKSNLTLPCFVIIIKKAAYAWV